MKLCWLHISDIHFHPKTLWSADSTRLALRNFLKAQIQKKVISKPDFIVCTGDIAYGELPKSTLTQQYGYAKSFLLNDLCRDMGLDKDHVFLIPGNHDTDRSKVLTVAQESWHERARKSRDHVNEICGWFEHLAADVKDAMRRLDSYQSFIEENLPLQHDVDGRASYARTIEIRGKKVGIAGFNSAWTCYGDSDDRNLWIAAAPQLARAEHDLEDCDVRLGLIHHPMDWLNEADREVLKKRVPNTFQFWLHGHAHDQWVTAEQDGPVTIGAGAIGAETAEEFGVNFVELDLELRTGVAHLFKYEKVANGWMYMNIPRKAESGMWKFNFGLAQSEVPDQATAAPPNEPEALDSSPVFASSTSIIERDDLSEHLAKTFDQSTCLAIYGFRGTGKSWAIDRLLRQKTQVDTCIQITAFPDDTPNHVYRQLAIALGDFRESPSIPKDFVEILRAQAHSNAIRPVCIRVDHAHRWLRGGRFVEERMASLIHTLIDATKGRWKWLFELREIPQEGVFHRDAVSVEVEGLSRSELKQLLDRNSRPATLLTADALKRLFAWLGGGHGHKANTFAAALLATLANAKQVAADELFVRLRGSVEEGVEAQLLSGLWEEVLSPSERSMLSAMALYGDGVPHDHLDRLEKNLQLAGASTGLERRMIVHADPVHSYYYLHGFVVDWARRRLGYPGASFDQRWLVLPSNLPPLQLSRLVELHQAIAEVWAVDIPKGARPSPINITRCSSALRHYIASGDLGGVQALATELLSHDAPAGTIKELWDLCNRQHVEGANFRVLHDTLLCIVSLDDRDHKAHRFLGETILKLEGNASERAYRHFEKACELDGERVEYLANLGKVARHIGGSRAESFVLRVGRLRDDTQRSHVVNDYVFMELANCLTSLARYADASALRQAQITAKTRNAAFYTDEANYLLKQHREGEALTVLDLARERGLEDEYLLSVRASVLEATGQGADASALRQAQITAKTRNAAFYTDEANYLLKQHREGEALTVLDLARERGLENEYLLSVRASVSVVVSRR